MPDPSPAFGPYVVESELGRGGMGVVYRARHRDTGAAVALKVLGGDAGDERAVARFRREIALARELRHPAIVSVLDAGETDGRAWFAMELVEGQGLDTYAAGADLSWREAAELARDVAAALAHAHAKGVLHRDVKPANVIMDRTGRARLTDFGLARRTAADTKFTRSGEILGTPNYASPEQARGSLEELAPATDVWSLGCLLYELLTGELAFGGTNVAQVIGNVVTREPEALSRLRPDLPRGLVRIVESCLRKAPGERYADGAAVQADLERLLAGAPVVGSGPGRSRRRAPVLAVVTLGLCAAAAAVLWAAWPAVAPPGAPDGPATASAAAEALARRGWGQRHTDLRAAQALLAQAVEQAPHRADWHLQLGLLDWATGQAEAARAEWSAVPRTAPESRRARLYTVLTVALDLGSRRSQSRPEHKAELQELSEGADQVARLAYGMLAVGMRHYAEAVQRLEGVPGWEAAYLRALAIRGKDPAALTRVEREYTAALDAGVGFTWAYYNRGVVRAALGNTSGALDDYTVCIKQRPDWPDGWHNRAATLRALGRVADAIRDEDTVIRLDPHHPNALYNRGMAHWAAGHLAPAEADLDRAVAEAPGDPEGWVGRGAVRMARGKLSEARADFEHALHLDPKHATAWLRRGQLHARLGDPAKAAADLTRAIACDDRLPDAYHERSVVYTALGKLRAALADTEQALALNPDKAEYYANRGALRHRLGDLPGAVADASKALELKPGTALWLLNRAKAYTELQQYDRVIADATAALEADAHHSGTWSLRAAAHNARKEVDAAIADYVQALTLDGHNAPALGGLGLIRYHRKQWAEAADLLERYTALKPNHPSIGALRKMIATARSRAAGGG